MELGFALVAALLYLAWLTERRVLLWPAFLLSLGLGSGLSLSSHQAGRPRLAAVVRRLGAPLGGDALDRRPALARARGLERPRAAADGVLALLGDRRPARRARRRRGRLHDVQALPGAPRPLVGRLRPAAARQARARRPRAARGARSTTSSSGRGSTGRPSRRRLSRSLRGRGVGRRWRSSCSPRSSSTRSRLRTACAGAGRDVTRR